MRSQEECPDASKHASKDTGILIPASDASHDLKTTLPRSRKRKRYESPVADLLDDAFIVKPHPSTIFTKPRTLRPVALVPRSQLPLSCLDLASLGTLPSSRLFESHVKILELEQRIGTTPVVLIARLDDGKTLFAVERESRGLYVLCKLGSWIDLNQLCATSIVSRYQPLVGDEEHTPSSNCESQITAEARKYHKRKRLAIEALQLMVKRPRGGVLLTSEALPVCESHQSRNPDSYPLAEAARRSPSQSSLLLEALYQKEELPAIQSRSGAAIEQASQEPSSRHVKQDDIPELPMADQILDSIRSQYFESLYLSKASLAYFAKGPLSRARAAFHLDYDSTLDMRDLVRFLDSIILPTNVLDKKYKDGVPGVLESMVIGGGSLDEAENGTSKPRRRKSKIMKPDTKGLYPTEDIFLRRWWGALDIESESGALTGSREDIMKKQTAQLRIRETQLQIIVILETLALQPLAKSQIDHSNELPRTGFKDATPDGKTTGRNKSKKSRDLVAILDIHVDRLCIWQSVAAEEETALGLVKELRDASESSGLTKDLPDTYDVREFCNGVIVPFFSARLPEQCAAISGKLGGHCISSLTGPKLSIASNLSVPSSRPGTVAKRRVTSKPRQSLQRVLTDERGGAISLMRSTTSLAVPRLKREGSESSLLGSVPHTETQAIHASRGGILKSKKFSQREVDLSSPAIANEAKHKKLNIEAELKDAIKALKRPNRQLAVQELVETAERRTFFAANNSRKSKRPIRSLLSQNVQIMATPKGYRKKDLTAEMHACPSLALEGDLEPKAAASTSIREVQQSISRVKGGVRLRNENQCNVSADELSSENKTSRKIQATPSRCQVVSKTKNFSTSPEVYKSRDGLPPSPLRTRCSSKSLPGTPLTNVIRNARTPTRVGVIQATPIKLPKEAGTSQTDSFTKSAREVENSGSTSERAMNGDENVPSSLIGDDSIYKKLGWDDGDLA